MKTIRLSIRKVILKFSTSSKGVFSPSVESDTIMRYSMVITHGSVSGESLAGVWLNTHHHSIMPKH